VCKPCGPRHSVVHDDWRPVPGTEGRVEVSSRGRVRLREADGWVALRRYPYGPGYLGVYFEGRGHYVHELVALAFLGPRPLGYEIDHVDGRRRNNRAEKLEYVTPGENQRRAYALGLRTDRGEAHHLARLTEADVRLIRSDPTISDAEYAEPFGDCENTIIHVRIRHRTPPHGSGTPNPTGIETPG
jgi:hypothetical protein